MVKLVETMDLKPKERMHSMSDISAELHDEELLRLKKELGESQAREAMLRAGFERLAHAVIEDEELHDETDENGAALDACNDGDCNCELPRLINSTLARPADDSALREFGLKVVRYARALDGPVLSAETTVENVLRGEQ